VKKIDTGRLLDETTNTQAAEMVIAQGNAKTIGIDPTTTLATMVGLVAAAGGWAMTMLVARTILPSNTRAAALWSIASLGVCDCELLNFINSSTNSMKAFVQATAA
jgi:hypothetical protein